MQEQLQDLRMLPQKSECLFTLNEVERALDRVAKGLTADVGDRHPVVLGVMTGAVPTLGYLLTRLPFMLELDYVHATRYLGERSGCELIWKRYPEVALAGRCVVLVDDILDRGVTLASIAEYCHLQGAQEVKVAVLAQKLLSEPPAIEADYCALKVPDRYVFGFGMDVQHQWRNAPGIFACD